MKLLETYAVERLFKEYRAVSSIADMKAHGVLVKTHDGTEIFLDIAHTRTYFLLRKRELEDKLKKYGIVMEPGTPQDCD